MSQSKKMGLVLGFLFGVMTLIVRLFYMGELNGVNPVLVCAGVPTTFSLGMLIIWLLNRDDGGSNYLKRNIREIKNLGLYSLIGVPIATLIGMIPTFDTCINAEALRNDQSLVIAYYVVAGLAYAFVMLMCLANHIWIRRRRQHRMRPPRRAVGSGFDGQGPEPWTPACELDDMEF